MNARHDRLSRGWFERSARRNDADALYRRVLRPR